MDAIEFLLEDYKLKVAYLSGHFSRMWTRFNFFLSIDSGLLAFSFSGESVHYAPYVAGVGFLLSLLWYRFAATDNFLVEVYRRQVAHVFHLLEASRKEAFKSAGIDPVPDGYSYVGGIGYRGFNPVTGRVETIMQTPWQNRSPRVSATELGVVFACLFALLWIARFVLWFLER